MSRESTEHMSVLLQRLASGDRSVEQALFESVYSDLRHRADELMRHQPADHTLQATALVHEAWLRIGDHPAQHSASRSEFLRLAASAMRSVLVDHARARTADKRGGGARKCTVEESIAWTHAPGDALLAVDEGLRALQDVDAELARVAELRLFAGLDHAEIASALSISTRTVERAWKLARAWLQRHLDGPAGG